MQGDEDLGVAAAETVDGALDLGAAGRVEQAADVVGGVGLQLVGSGVTPPGGADDDESLNGAEVVGAIEEELDLGRLSNLDVVLGIFE